MSTDQLRVNHWLVSPKYDLLFFSGSIVVSWLFWGSYLWGKSYHKEGTILLIVLIFNIFFDHPHIFQTFSRTHGDPRTFGDRTWQRWVPIFFILMGLLLKDFSEERNVLLFFACFGVFHIFRQNLGFLRLYQRKVEGKNSFLSQLEIRVLTLVWGYAVSCRMFAYRFLFPEILKLPINHWNTYVTPCLFWAMLLSLGFLGILWVREYFSGQLSYPKTLFFISMVGNFLLTYAYIDVPLEVFIAIETAYHDIQYQGWIRYYQKSYFSKEARRSWLKASFFYGLIFGVFFVYLPFSDFFRVMLWLFNLMVFYHYIIDGFIWRTRFHPEISNLIRQPSGLH